MAWSQLEVVWQKTFPEIIQFAKFSPDGKYLYCAIGDSIVIMDPISGERLRRFQGTRPYPCYHLSISNSGNYLISGFSGGIAIWDVKSEIYLKQFGGGIVFLAISNDDKYMYWIYADGMIRIVDMQNDSIIKQIQIHSIQSAQISNSGKMFAIGYPYKKFNPNGGIDDYVKLELWDAEKLELIRVLQDTKSSEGYRNFDFSIDDKFFAATDAIKLYTTIYDLIENKISFTSKSNNYNFKFTKDNTRLFYFGNKQLELMKESGEIYKYTVSDKVMETGGTESLWNVFMGAGKGYTLLKNSITSVNYESEIPYLIINYTQDGILHLKCSYDVEPPIEITICDIEGKIIYISSETELQSTKEMSFRLNLSNGTYIVKATTKNKIYTQKFQVMR
jgi:hypothetical protein